MLLCAVARGSRAVVALGSSTARRGVGRAHASTVALPAAKATTGLTGLNVVPNAREVLIKLYEKTLRDIQIIPPTVAYRLSVESFTSFRLGVVRDNADIADIERIVGCGQVEELIEQAKGELILIPEYAAWKVWDAKPAAPEDDDFADLYEDLEFVDPASVEYLGLRDLAARKRAEAAAQRAGGADAMAATYQARADVNAAAEQRKAAAAAAAKPK